MDYALNARDFLCVRKYCRQLCLVKVRSRKSIRGWVRLSVRRPVGRFVGHASVNKKDPRCLWPNENNQSEQCMHFYCVVVPACLFVCVCMKLENPMAKDPYCTST